MLPSSRVRNKFYGEQRVRRADPLPCLTPRYAAQVAPLRCPILRSDLNHIRVGLPLARFAFVFFVFNLVTIGLNK